MFEKYADVVTVKELTKMLKIGRNSAYDLIKTDAVKSVKIGAQIRISKLSVISYLSGEGRPPQK